MKKLLATVFVWALATCPAMADGPGPLPVQFGTTAGTAAQGNDSRITNALQLDGNSLAPVSNLPKLWNITTNTPNANALFRYQYTVNGTGGTLGFVVPNLWVNTIVGPGNTNNYVWSALNQLTVNGSTSGQHVADYSQAVRNSGSAPVWAGVSDAKDLSGLSSSASGGALIGHEFDLTANDLDANSIRVGLDVVGFEAPTNTTPAQFGYGLRIGPQNGNTALASFIDGLRLNGIFSNSAIDLSNVTLQPGAVPIRLPANGQIGSAGGPAITVGNAANAVNTVRVTPAATGGNATIDVYGDASANLIVKAAGSGAVYNQATVFMGYNYSNFISATGATAGSGPSLSVAGSDTNIALNLKGKGSGVVGLQGEASLQASEDHTVSSVTASFTFDATMQMRVADATSAAVVGTLPACVAAIAGREYTLVKADTSANAVSFAPNGTDKISGTNANLSVGTTQGSAINLRCNGNGTGVTAGWWRH